MAIEPIIVSYSELDTFRQCPLKHYLAYVLRYKKPPSGDSALAKGSLWHQVMETHYRAIFQEQQRQAAKGNTRIPLSSEKPLLAEIREQVIAMLFDPKSGDAWSDQHDLIWWMYEGHVDKYGIDRQWKILAIEHNIVTPLRDARGRRTRYHLKAKIDLIVMERATGAIWVIDHKSGANLPTQMDLDIDDQFGLYSWAMNEVGRPVAGTIHSAARTTRNKGDYPDAESKYKAQTLDQRMHRTFLNRSKKELVNLALDAYEAARAAHPPKGTTRPRYSAPDPRQCGWKCDFKEPHLLMRKGRKPDEVLHEYGFVIDRTRH